MFKVRYYKVLESTNSAAWEMALEAAPHGTVVIAETQTRGRGQHERGFLSPRGGLYLSLILRPAFSPDKLTILTPTAGVAVCRAIKEVCPELSPQIKPVNDVRINKRKVCGILAESAVKDDRIEFAVVGMGINVNTLPEVLDQPVTSLEESAGRPVALEAIREALLEQLIPLLNGGFESMSQSEYISLIEA